MGAEGYAYIQDRNIGRWEKQITYVYISLFPRPRQLNMFFKNPPTHKICPFLSPKKSQFSCLVSHPAFGLGKSFLPGKVFPPNILFFAFLYWYWNIKWTQWTLMLTDTTRFIKERTSNSTTCRKRAGSFDFPCTARTGKKSHPSTTSSSSLPIHACFIVSLNSQS